MCMYSGGADRKCGENTMVKVWFRHENDMDMLRERSWLKLK